MASGGGELPTHGCFIAYPPSSDEEEVDSEEEKEDSD
jgi:hypothetical protein